MFTEPATGKPNGKTVRGRKDNDGIAKVPETIPESKYKDLENLARKADQANEAFNDACTKTAKSYGHNASVVKKVVKARVGDTFDDEKRKVEQLAFAFGVIDTVSTPETPDAED